MFDDFIDGFEGSELEFEQVPFNHPLFVMYSSGTTGTPKCMVHSVGVCGILKLRRLYQYCFSRYWCSLDHTDKTQLK